MLCFLHLSPLGLRTGCGLSPSSCLLPHISPTANNFPEHDEMLGSRHRGDPAAALLQAPMQAPTTTAAARSPTTTATRRGVLTAAASTAAATVTVSLPGQAEAAQGAAVELVEQIGTLSMQARALQFAIREDAPANRNDDAPLRALVARERRQLQQLAATMAAAAPDLRLCDPEAADCDCVPDPVLMRAAARYAASAEARLAALDGVLAKRGAFDELRDGAAVYPAGTVERELEMLCEATDAFLDLAAGRPANPMAARLAPVRPALAPALVVPRRMPVRAANDAAAPPLRV